MSQWDPRCEEDLRMQLFVAALLAVSFWLMSLFADVQIYGPGRSMVGGWFLLAVGWFAGPLSLSVAWYANIPLFVCLWRMLLGRLPNFWLASIALSIALSSLLPMLMGNMVTLVRGPGVWLWLASFLVIWIPPAFMRWPGRRSESEATG